LILYKEEIYTDTIWRLKSHGWCYGLDKCLPKSYGLRVWSSTHCTIGRLWSVWEVGPSGRFLGHLEYALEGTGAPQSLPLSCFLPWGEWFCSSTCFHHDVLPHYRPQTARPINHGLYLQNCKPKHICYLCKLIISGICYSGRKLTNTIGQPQQASLWWGLFSCIKHGRQYNVSGVHGRVILWWETGRDVFILS
jgi:hypothetical protein